MMEITVYNQITRKTRSFRTSSKNVNQSNNSKKENRKTHSYIAHYIKV